MSEPRIAPSAKPDSLEVNQYLNQLLSSPRFHKAPVLSQLLQYLVTKAAEGRVDEIKESIIAIDVFGHSQDFDSRLDNIVRVQAHRLRKMLEAHYEAEGSGDKFRITIPKGSYVPQVRWRDEGQVEAVAGPAASTVEAPAGGPAELAADAPGAPADGKKRAHFAKLGLAFAATFFVGALAAILFAPWIGSAPKARGASPGAEDMRVMPLAALWGGLLAPNLNVVLSFTDPAFLWTHAGRTQIYMTYGGPLSAPVGTQIDISPDDPYVDPGMVKRGGPFFFSDSWTGTGEVFGVYRLTRLLTEAGKPLKVIRSRAMTYNDMRDANVIFIGSTWANELQEKFNTGETPLVCYGRERIANRNPRPGEPSEFLPVYDPTTKQLVASYVLFSVLPGVTPGTKIICSAGIQTYGTHAGIEYLTSAAGVSELIRRFDPAGKRKLPNHFQAVIRHEVVRGEPANESLVLVRDLDSEPAGAAAGRK
jgi:hypothetical protein